MKVYVLLRGYVDYVEVISVYASRELVDRAMKRLGGAVSGYFIEEHLVQGS